ncbi:ribbon-helix-helix protein, CopG family [Nocardioides sambongensis]|uniref:ribbon-helix-helix protein, CopG family n=1 Tax=Nocardioides sambongensis TaxID=2589074 RepID=UPI00112C577E|nr:ribbon-helix-helix protein, CopG family [Nocardioides sambongensis]
MRTTVSIDDDLLARAKVLAAQSHRSIGSVLEEALRALLEARAAAEHPDGGAFRLPRFDYPVPAEGAAIDLYDREVVEDLLGEGDVRAVL